MIVLKKEKTFEDVLYETDPDAYFEDARQWWNFVKLFGKENPAHEKWKQECHEIWLKKWGK